MTDVKKLLSKLENDESIGHELVVRLKNEGYITAKILENIGGSVAFATYTGLTEKGKRVLRDED
jgi:hypothetical protein